MAELLNSLFRLNSDRIRNYVDKHRTQHPHLSNFELAQKISTRKSIKNGLLGAGTGVFGVLLLPITITADGLKSFRAEAFLFKCINYIYGIDPDNETINAIFPLLIAADSIAEFETEIERFLEMLWNSEENQSFMIQSLKKSAIKAAVKQVPELATKFTIHQFGTTIATQVVKGMPKQVMKSFWRVSGRKLTGRVAAKSFGKAIPLLGAMTGFAMDWHSIREQGKLAIQFHEEGVMVWTHSLFTQTKTHIEKIAESKGSNESLIYVQSYFDTQTTQDWISKLRQQGWQGAIYHCWSDAFTVQNLVSDTPTQRNRIDCKKQFKTSDLIGGYFLPEYVKYAIQTEQITLVGHAMGARAVLNSLKTWDSSLPLIKNVVLLGGLLPTQNSEWSQYSEKVSGRILNAYNHQDPVLKRIYQLSHRQEQFCGLAPIDSTSPQLLNLNSSEPVGQSHCSVHYLNSLLQMNDAEFSLCKP